MMPGESPIDNIHIKKNGISRAEITQIATIQRREVGKGFLSSLGDRALELVFSHAAESELGELIVAIDVSKGRVCGFICGTTNTGALFGRFLSRKLIHAAIYVAPKVLSPPRLWKVLETLIYPLKREMAETPNAELLVIAIDKNYQGQGIGQILFRQFVNALHNKGVNDFKIIVGDDLVRARNFYEQLGAEKTESIQVHRGQKSCVYIYSMGQTNHID